MQIKLSEIKILSQEEFLSHNRMHIQKDVVAYNRLAKKIVDTEYLPKLSIVGSYQYEDNKYNKEIRDDKDNWGYGLNLSMPLDYNSKKIKQIAQKEFLLSKIQYQNSQDNEKIFYQNTLHKIKFLERKIKNNQEAKSSYDSLIV